MTANNKVQWFVACALLIGCLGALCSHTYTNAPIAGALFLGLLGSLIWMLVLRLRKRP
jgi:hypothetical protein